MQIITSIPQTRNVKTLSFTKSTVQLLQDLSRRALHTDIQDAASVHPTLRAAASSFGRSLIGSTWRIVPHQEYGEEGTDEQRLDILDFFSPLPDGKVTSFKDLFCTSAKLWGTAGALLLFGHTAWEPIRNGFGKAIGFDNVFGFIQPRVGDDGTFESPAYTQFIQRSSGMKTVDFKNPDDLVFFAIPDWVSANLWSVDIEALASYSLPSDIYAMLAYLSMHKHLNAPLHGHWEVDPDVDDDDFDAFHDILRARYAGSEFYAKNPLIIRGTASFKEVSRDTDDAPYIEGRRGTTQEIDGVTGVPAFRRGSATGINRAIAKELRREFWEATLQPWVRVMEEIIWAQVCVREFDTRGWALKFDPPDFITATERASVAMREVQWGIKSPNEIREEQGVKEREGGDYYLVPKNMSVQPLGEQGGPPDPVDDEDGNLPPAEEDPVPGQDPPERPRDDALVAAETKAWRRFAIKVAKGQRGRRPFEARYISAEMAINIQETLDEIGDDIEKIVLFFDSLEGR